jgi:hypothetical protein
MCELLSRPAFAEKVTEREGICSVERAAARTPSPNLTNAKALVEKRQGGVAPEPASPAPSLGYPCTLSWLRAFVSVVTKSPEIRSSEGI